MHTVKSSKCILSLRIMLLNVAPDFPFENDAKQVPVTRDHTGTFIHGQSMSRSEKLRLCPSSQNSRALVTCPPLRCWKAYSSKSLLDGETLWKTT